jgi:hypothetical protein
MCPHVKKIDLRSKFKFLPVHNFEYYRRKIYGVSTEEVQVLLQILFK